MVEDAPVMKMAIASTVLQTPAIALTHNAILLTRNESDFRQIIELQIEDWAA
jgi:predicted nucleic acid-binding protein